MKKLLNKILLVVLLALSTPVLSQIDTVFWFAAPWVTVGHAGNTPVVMRLSSFNNATTVRVRQPASTFDTTFVIPANSLISESLSHIINQVENTPANTVLNRGFKITSDFPITVVYEIVSTGNNPETYSMKGQNGMGLEFVCPFQTNGINWTFTPTAKSQIDIVATQNGTIVWITPKCNVVGHAAGVTYSVGLNAGQSYDIENVTNVANVAGQNLSGTIVVSNKPISVTVTDDSVRGVSGCMDIMGDQIVPVEVVGTEYIINKGGLSAGEFEGAYVVATANFTQITINDGVITTKFLNKGDTYYYPTGQPLTYITGDKPFYVIHASGFGCELGEAIIPPLNCAGSDQVSFTRTNTQTFILNILCKTSAKGNFLLNGSAALVPAASFTVVPGTGGLWSGAQISFTTGQIAVGVTNLLRNTNATDNLFSMGVINGGATTGCLYHYMSSFLRKVITNAGIDQNICTATNTISLTGSVTGGSTTGIWTTPNGTGTFGNTTSLNTTYTLSANDLNQSQIKFILSSTGNCTPKIDTMLLNVFPSPIVNAGSSLTLCKNNMSSIALSGSLQLAAGANWTSSGTGSFGNAGALNTTYVPSPADLASNSLTLSLTSTGSLNGCPNRMDSLVLTLTNPPIVTSGSDISVCANNATVAINGTVTGASTTGIWSGGVGTYNPSNTNLSASYIPTPAEIAAGSVKIILSSTGNGNCKQVKDSLTITFTSAPAVNAGPDLSVCKNNIATVLSGLISGPTTTGSWTGGAGTFNPNNTTLNSIYTPNAAELAAGSVTLTLTSTSNGNCTQVTDKVVINFTNPPTVNAGLDLSVCKNNLSAILSGTVAGVTTTGIWSGGSGSFNPGNSALSATYTPSPSEITAGVASLTLTSTSNGNCNAVTDVMQINLTNAPTVNAGADINSCSNNANTVLNGVVAGPTTTGSWSGGAGSYNPGNSALTATYTPSAAEITAGVATLTLTSTGNGNCNAVVDIVQINFTPAPIVNAGIDLSVCKNNAAAALSGLVSGATATGIWSGGAGTYNPNSTNLNSIYTPNAAELAAGSVTLTLTSTSNGNCTQVTDKVVINFTNPPTVNAGLDLSVCKNNLSAILSGTVAGVTTTGIWSGGSGSFNPGNSALSATYTPSPSEITAGVASLTLTSTSNGNCNAVTDVMQINLTNAPTVNAGSDINSCSNNANTVLNGVVAGPTTTGSWTGGAGSYNPGNSALTATYTPTSAEITAGVATLTLTSTGNGNCNAVVDIVQINFTAIPSVNAGLDLTSCINNAATALSGLVSGATTTGSWSGGAGTYNPNNANLNSIYTPNAVELAAGSVTLTLTSTNNGNCSQVTDNVVINFTNPATVNAGTDLTVCNNNASTVLTGLVSGITTTGVWSGGSGLYNPNNTVLTTTYTPSASEITAGFANLYLTSTNNGNCSQVVDTVKIILTNAPNVNAGADVFACENNITTILAGVVSGPTTTGIWSGGLGTFNPGNSALTTTYTPSPSEITAGFVILTLSSTNNGNCNAENDVVQINFTSAPNVIAGNDISSCQNNPTSILSGIVTGPTTTGIWSGGSGTYNPSNTNLNSIYSPSASELAAGSVTLTLTSTNNGSCLQVVDTVVINYSNSPIANAGLDFNVCKNNASTILAGNVTGSTSTGIWTGGSGTYNPNNSTLNANYTPSAAELAAGTTSLYLTSTNNGNCNQVVDTIIISFTDAPSVLAGPDISVCANNPTVNISGSVSLGSTTGIWSSTGSGTFASNTSMNTTYQLSASDVAIGNVIIKLTSTNNGNCGSEFDSLIVNVTPKPDVNAGLNDTICSSNVFIPINGIVSGGASSGTWSSLGNGSFGNITNLNTVYTFGQADTLAGQVSLVLTSTGGSCLPETDTLLIVLTKAPIVNSGVDMIVCDNQLVSLNGYVAGLTNTGVWTTLGTGVFSPNDSTLTTFYQPSPLDIANGTIQLLLTSTDNKGCAAVKDTLDVSFKTSPVVNFSTSNVCANNIASFNDLSSSPSGSITSYSWDFGDTQTSASMNTTHLYNSAGTYTVTHVVSNTNGCADTIRQPLEIYFLPQAQFYLNPACVGNATQFTDSTKTLSGTIQNWLWNFGDGQTSTFQNPSHGFGSPTSYTVSLIVTSSFGCKDTVQKTVTVVPGPQANFSINPNPVEALETANFTDLSTGPNSLVNWYWAFGDSTASNSQNTTHVFNDQGDYSILLVVKDINGCIDSARQDISIILLPDVPTAFTPNGDGENDLFLVRGGPFKSINVRIYNNWGQLIFETNDQLEGWNGKFKEVDQPLGVFVWVVEVEMFNDKKIKKTGDVTLLR